MQATKYTYSIAGDFPNDQVDPSRLEREIRASSITTALDYINTSGDDCDLWFKASLDSGEVATLDGLVAAHSGERLPDSPQLMAFAKADGTPAPAAPDGRPDIRVTTAKRTTNFNLRAMSFTTSKANSIHNINPVTDADWGDFTMALKKWDATENGGAGGWVTATDDDAEKTVLDWEPHYNFEIIGGYLDLPTALKDGTTDQWFLACIGVPDYAPAYGGQVPYISEINLEAVTTSKVTSDGRAISYLAYNYGGAPHTNRLRFIVKHPAGAQKRFQLYVEHYV